MCPDTAARSKVIAKPDNKGLLMPIGILTHVCRALLKLMDGPRSNTGDSLFVSVNVDVQLYPPSRTRLF